MPPVWWGMRPASTTDWSRVCSCSHTISDDAVQELEAGGPFLSIKRCCGVYRWLSCLARARKWTWCSQLMTDCEQLQKFGARRGSGGTATGREEAVPPTNNNRQTSNAAASGMERRPTANAARASVQGASPATGASGKEKPALPEFSDESCQAAYAEALPSFREVPASEKQHLFVRKLHLCAFTFDFTDQAKHVREKEIKRQTLLELVDYVNTGSGKFTEAVAEDIVFMLSYNLFRALPPTRSHDQDNLDPDEEEPALEPAWPHLQVQPSPCAHTHRALPQGPQACHRHCASRLIFSIGANHSIPAHCMAVAAWGGRMRGRDSAGRLRACAHGGPVIGSRHGVPELRRPGHLLTLCA